MTIGSTSMSPLTKGAEPPSEAEKIRKAATGFEALFVAQLLRSARESAATEQDQSGSAMMEVAEEQIALSISDRGGLGLAQSIVDSLGKLNAIPPSTTRMLGSLSGAK
jgi:Rod binding domain-containing protein